MKLPKFFSYLFPFWKKETLIAILSLVSVGLSLVNPYLTKLIIDQAYGNRDLKLFILLILLGGFVYLLSGLAQGISGYLNYLIRLSINFLLNKKLFKKLQAMPYNFFQDGATGEHIFKVSYDIEQVSQLLSDVLPQAILLIPRSLLILAVVLFMNWKMALLALALAPFLYFVPWYFNRKLRKVFEVWVKNYENIFSKLQEILSHMYLVKAFHTERAEIKRHVSALVKNIRFNLGNTRLEVAGSFVNNLVNRVVLGLIIFYGGYQVIKGRMSLGSLSAITIYLNQLSGMQDGLGRFFQQISLGMVSWRRLSVVLDAEEENIERKEAKETIIKEGRLDFQNVNFSYKEEKLIFRGLSFSVKAGACIGMVGPSGYGKTTLINLILRLYKLNSGAIMIDGSNIELIKAKSLYNQIGVVLQEPYLWNDTIENNIKYGREDSGLEEVKWAAQIACIDDFVNSLPEGYQTVIGENACKISEGQKQRIAIARAVIKRPKILILDEALSSVDAMVEGEIIDNLKGYLNGSTIIIISHRLSTIKKMGLVYFLMSPGRIDIDTHEGLLARSAEYQKYLAHQLEEEKALK